MKLWWKRRKADEASRDPRPAAELQIHCAIVELLRVKALPSLIWFHVPNGEKRDKRTAAKLERMGVLAGVPDIAFVFRNGEAAFIEVKRAGGRLSPQQIAFLSRCRDNGINHAVVSSVDEAAEVLWHWGALKGPAPVRRAA